MRASTSLFLAAMTMALHSPIGAQAAAPAPAFSPAAGAFDQAVAGKVLAALATALEDKAAATFQAGQKANLISDAFVHVTVVLASAMFFGGICQAFRSPLLRLLLAIGSVGACAWGVFEALRLPPA